MTQTAEEQILAAAQHSMEDKLRRYTALAPELKTALAEELGQGDAALKAFSPVLIEGEIPVWLAGQAPQELEQLHESLAARYTAMFPPAEPVRVPSVQSLSLVDFEDESDQSDDDDGEGFSLIDFDGQSESEASVPAAALREPLWLLTQLTAAWYYVHCLKP